MLNRSASCRALPLAIALGLSLWAVSPQPEVKAGGLIRAPAVGGVSIDAEGVMSSPQVGELNELAAAWQSALSDVPQDMSQPSAMRFVSLKGIEAAVAKAAADGVPIADEVQFLAGLTRIEYVLVLPDRNDIVLAGPAEGWKVDGLGNVVGQASNRPVVLLDDLMAAWRSARKQLGSGMSCSIDPTPQGLAKVQEISKQLTAQGQGGVQAAARQVEQALGYQVISVTGVPANSHFARVMVGADFRMKRLAMDLDRAPIDGLPSYLQLVGTGGSGMQNLLPRWWLAPKYEPLVRDEAGLAWKIRGGVQCMSEEDFVDATGQRTQTGKSNNAAKKWADTFTGRFEELASHDSSFGQLQSLMDVAVVTTLIEHQQLAAKAKLELPQIIESYPLIELNAPRRVASQASFLRKGSKWVLSASGGVQLAPGEVVGSIAPQPEAIPAAATLGSLTQAAPDAWWWDQK